VTVNIFNVFDAQAYVRNVSCDLLVLREESSDAALRPIANDQSQLTYWSEVKECLIPTWD